MYRLSAAHYDAIYAAKDYAGEAAQIRDLVAARRGRHGGRLLDVACGTGRHLEHLRAHFEAAGLDLEPGLLAEARRRLPGLPLHQGDMRAFDLGERFDVVTCLFSAIGYVRTRAGLARALRSMARHLAPGGVLLVEPWFTPEAWRGGKSTVHLKTVDLPELKIARACTSLTRGRLSVMDMHHLVSTPEGTRHFKERHSIGLFTVDEMRAGFRAAGLAADLEEPGLSGRGLWVAGWG
ncbi:MAG: class I SAM-dependent methyltransferase [Ardenticatenia bacterium]|nr:class I SAM-dependent methyltransferase [Ardenticatenia bacterium]